MGIVRHIIFIAGITVLLIVCIIYPFLPGKYDPLAVPLSTMAQVFGVVGLPLSLVGLLWLLMPRYKVVFIIIYLVLATFVALIIALFAALSVGNAFGILTVAVWVYVLLWQIPKLKKLKSTRNSLFNYTPWYLVTLPVFSLFFQLVLAKPMTQYSKNRAIVHAGAFIGDIRQYNAHYGRYPLSLQAQNKDYYPDVVGVEKYHYASQGGGYNLSFEQPRFLLDRFGTREWIVYNPLDEQRAYSHVAWLLPGFDTSAPNQGWYASGATGHPNWKYFWFD
jgi:hypothetical protein